MEKPLDIHISVYGRTDVGLIRDHNEDSFLIANTTSGERTMSPEDLIHISLESKGALFLVCDGMGGAAAGEVASTMAVETISDDMSQGTPTTRERFTRRLRRAIENANAKIHLQSRNNQSERGMGTTCTAVALMDGNLIVGQIGDSRCYLLRSGKLTQLTKDQSLAWQLIEAGAMTAEEAKSFEHANIILQALGVQDKVDVILSSCQLCKDDVVLISSDGLHGPVADDELRDILLATTDPKQACDDLIEKALEREGPDNVTVVVARFDGAGLSAPRPEEEVNVLACDPGVDEDFDPSTKQFPLLVDKVTAEVPIRPDILELFSSGAIPANSSDANLAAIKRSGTSSEVHKPNESAKPLLTFVLVTLLAALAGALFLAFQKTNWPEFPPPALETTDTRHSTLPPDAGHLPSTFR
jgi:serine/threonine protein phosphatase PrpC